MLTDDTNVSLKSKRLKGKLLKFLRKFIEFAITKVNIQKNQLHTYAQKTNQKKKKREKDPIHNSHEIYYYVNISQIKVCKNYMKKIKLH